MPTAHRYMLPNRFYLRTFADDGGFLPANSTYDDLPPLPWVKIWHQHIDGVGWKGIEDHRERKAPYFAPEFEQGGTQYWLPEDTHDSPSRTMKNPGPLPEGALFERPGKLLITVQAEKRREIETGHEAALAGAVALSDPSPSTVAVEAGLLAASDPEGLEFVRDALAARRDELLAEVVAAESLAAVEAIKVSYAV